MSGNLYREYIDKVKRATDLLDLFREAKIPPNETNMVPCPFHPDSKPSMSVHPLHQFFHCFGCGQSGDVFTFVQKIDGLSFKPAVDKLAVRAGIPVYRPLQAHAQEVDWDRAIADAVEEAACYYQAKLVTNAPARAYLLDQRRLPEEFIARFRLGWADGYMLTEILSQWGQAWGPVFERAGLATEIKNATGWSGSSYRDFFFDRVMFPCFRGAFPRATFLSGRTIGNGEPKYLNQRGDDRPLYNEDALNPSHAFIVEGQIDTLSLVAWGFPAVGLLGGMLPSALAKLRRPQVIYSCLDPDRAGLASTVKLCAALGPYAVRTIPLPDGVDPNDFYRTRTKGEFEDLVTKAVDPVTHLIVRGSSSGLDLPRTLEPILRLLAALPPVTAETYLETVRDRLDVRGPLLKAARDQIADYREGVAQCPACGTAISRRQIRS